MFNISITAKKMLFILFALGLIFFGVTYAFGYKSLSYGILFGVIISSFRIYILNYNISKLLYMGTKQAKNYMIFNFSFRMLLVGFAFYLSVKSDKIDVIGTFIGVLLLQPSAYFVQFFLKDSDIPLNKEKVIKFDEEDTDSTEEFKRDLKGYKKTKEILKEMFK